MAILAGTRLRTPQGDVPAESLRIGDKLVTADGQAAPIRWIGRRRLFRSLLRGYQRPEMMPVRIRRNAIADGLPARDLLLSPGHGLCLRGGLLAARRLANGRTVTRCDTVEEVLYLDIELPGHAVIFAEGVGVESWPPTGSRNAFDNAVEYLDHYGAAPPAPTGPNLPRLAAGPAVEEALRQVAERAQPGFTADVDPDMHLLADGVAIRPESLPDRIHRFALPADAQVMRLVSRSVVPAEIEPGNTDARRIGVPVERIVFRAEHVRTEIEPCFLALEPGFHSSERTHVWTDGCARLPTRLCREFPGPVTLEVRLRPSLLPYMVPAEERPPA